MADSETLQRSIRLNPKPRLTPSPDGQPDSEEAIAPGDAYAVARGTRMPVALKFITIDDTPLTMPYTFPYIVWDVSPLLILLEYPRFFTMLLAGHGLTPLEADLSRHRVAWIRQCTAAQAGSLATAVTRIERLHSFPSRDGAGKLVF